MGTTILAAPAIRKARETLGAELFFVIFKKNVGSLELLQTFPAANVFTIRDDSLLHLALDSLSFLIWTRRKRIDTAIDLELFSRFTALLTGLCGAQRRVGFYRFHNEGLYRGEMLTHRVSYNPHIHIALNLLSLVNALIVGEKQTPYAKTLVEDEDLTVALPKPSPGQLQEMAGKLQALIGRAPGDGPILLVNPNASELLPHRRWMPERYAELIRRVLAHDERCAVVITGSPSEAPEAAAIGAPGRGALLFACGANRACRIARPLRAIHSDGDQRFRAIAFFGGLGFADHRSVRPGNAEALSTAWHFASDLCRACLFALCQCLQSSQDRLRQQCLHAGDRRGVGLPRSCCGFGTPCGGYGCPRYLVGAAIPS